MRAWLLCVTAASRCSCVGMGKDGSCLHTVSYVMRRNSFLAFNRFVKDSPSFFRLWQPPFPFCWSQCGLSPPSFLQPFSIPYEHIQAIVRHTPPFIKATAMSTNYASCNEKVRNVQQRTIEDH